MIELIFYINLKSILWIINLHNIHERDVGNLEINIHMKDSMTIVKYTSFTSNLMYIKQCTTTNMSSETLKTIIINIGSKPSFKFY